MESDRGRAWLRGQVSYLVGIKKFFKLKDDNYKEDRTLGYSRMK